jgi:hypothetical protein
LLSAFKKTITTIESGSNESSKLIANCPIKLGRQLSIAWYFLDMVADIASSPFRVKLLILPILFKIS